MTTPYAEPRLSTLSTGRARVSGHDVIAIDQGWQVASADPGEVSDPSALRDATWSSTGVPGTAAGAWRDAHMEPGDVDGRDWWFRTSFVAPPAGDGEELVLAMHGLATIADVYLNGEPVLHSESMFARHAVDVTSLIRSRNELAICCRALAPQLAVQRKPRARWRTRLVADNNLRWFRTMLLGRIPSFSAGPAAAGPWRPITLERRRTLAVDRLVVRSRLDGDGGVVSIEAAIREIGEPLDDGAVLAVEGPAGLHEIALRAVRDGHVVHLGGELRIPAVARWWPHTHGDPVLHAVRLVAGQRGQETTIDAGRVGFRSLGAGRDPDHDLERDGLALHVNGVPIFARGALWTPLDVVDLSPSPEELGAALDMVVAAGMNMLRLPGFGPYEEDAFHDLCDEKGILVWQDLAFASMDYPFDDEAFRNAAEAEARDVVVQLAGRPSTVVLCGNSEVEQQVAMLSLDPGLARIPFFDRTVPELAAAAGLDAVYVPSSTYGGDFAIRPHRGVTSYYGVGGYRGPLSDARTSGVRFAAECLAFANVPDEEALANLVPEPPGEAFVHHPRWKAGVARDAGSGWDFDDVRDHYFRLIFGIDPGELRRADHPRYLELSRAVTGEVMAHVFGEWRREDSPCGGGLILWLRDLVPGAGYGVIDDHGRTKAPYHHLRRALAPAAVWLVDEGIGGLIAHVANDGPSALVARLRVSLYTDREVPVAGGELELEVPPHGQVAHDVESVVGFFVDATWAYRFGPPAQDVIVASLERPAGDGFELMSQAFHFPAGRPLEHEPEHRLGLTATLVEDGSTTRVTVSSRRVAYGVRLHVPGYVPADDAFNVEPGGSRSIALRPVDGDGQFVGGSVTALNLAGQVPIRPGATAS